MTAPPGPRARDPLAKPAVSLDDRRARRGLVKSHPISEGLKDRDIIPTRQNQIKPQSFITFGAVSGFVAVAAGAFGAHGLQATLTPKMLDVWQTGAHYQLVHSVVLLFVGLFGLTKPELAKPLNVIGWLFTAGIVIFAGSLYALAVTDIKILGAITPFGGLAMLAGWAYLAFTGSKLR